MKPIAVAWWLDRFPGPDRADVTSRLRSTNDNQFRSAFWELYLHETLLRAGFTIEIHPALPDTDRRPAPNRRRKIALSRLLAP